MKQKEIEQTKNPEQKKWVEDEEQSDDAEVIKLDVGESITGILLEKKPSDTFGFVYKIQKKDDPVPKIICGTTILVKKMMNKEIGSEILIERIDDFKTKKGRFAHDYKTYHLEESRE